MNIAITFIKAKAKAKVFSPLAPVLTSAESDDYLIESTYMSPRRGLED
jgi:hypothetical protein